MTWPPCGSGRCPIAEPTPNLLRKTRTAVLDIPDGWWRGRAHTDRPDALVPGVGDTRFAPLPETRHAYIGRSRTVALLESVLHHTSGPAPTIYRATLADWVVAEVTLTEPVRLFDLRDPELARLAIPRVALTDTTARHYPCTRVWASRLQHRAPGGHPVAGIIWHSRQADLHARANQAGLLADLLQHRPADVAVLWHPAGPPAPLSATGQTVALLDATGGPTRLLSELSALIGAPIL